jgi:hypothetical protein
MLWLDPWPLLCSMSARPPPLVWHQEAAVAATLQVLRKVQRIMIRIPHAASAVRALPAWIHPTSAAEVSLLALLLCCLAGDPGISRTKSHDE